MSTPRLIFPEERMPDAAGQADAQAARRLPVVVSSAPDGGEEAQIRELPDALIHRGLCLYAAGKWLEAARVWEQSLEVATAGADAGSVNNLIENAYVRRPAAAGDGRHLPRREDQPDGPAADRDLSHVGS